MNAMLAALTLALPTAPSDTLSWLWHARHHRIAERIQDAIVLVVVTAAQAPQEPPQPQVSTEPAKAVPVTFSRGQIPFLGVKEVGTWHYDRTALAGSMERENGQILFLPPLPGGPYRIEFWVNGDKRPRLAHSWLVQIDDKLASTKPGDGMGAGGSVVPARVVLPEPPKPDENKKLLVEIKTALADVAALVKELQPPPLTAPGELRVLIVCDRLEDLTTAQIAALKASSVRDWLNAHCKRFEDGKPGWHVRERNASSDRDSESWQRIWTAVKPKLSSRPSIVFVSGKSVDVKPLPESEAAMLAMLRERDG